MSEIADFINAQYRRIEEAARAATDGPWSVGSVMPDIGNADVLSSSGNITSAREEPPGYGVIVAHPGKERKP